LRSATTTRRSICSLTSLKPGTTGVPPSRISAVTTTPSPTEAIRLKPDFALAYCNRGLANFQLGRFDDALADYTVAIDRDATLTYCYFNRGNLYLTLGEYQKAIDDLTRTLATNTRDAVALTRRGQAYEALGQLDKALDNFRSALEIAPRLESAEEGFARITQQQKHTNSGK
jgi:tetratricopeptide (TPR) repeat protein